VALFDLDHFKRLNDSYGHGAGDMAIRRFGGILIATVRASDLPCRYGGEEFVIVLPDTTVEAGVAAMTCEVIDPVQPAADHVVHGMHGVCLLLSRSSPCRCLLPPVSCPA
jgi:two-component system cell cycle response regulator